MTELTLYNSLTRKKEVFTPRDPKRVTMYNCGPTVYSYAHIGNARAAVVADVLFRVLRHIYGDDHVVYARNITDVDDKIIAAATEQGVEISEITEKYARIYNEDLEALGCLPPTHQPKATEHIEGMIAMIETLIKDGYAYESEGHVFFDVSKFDEYGQLSGNTLDALKKGDRVGEAEYARKRNAADFVLWKPPSEGVGWDAPFGKGRPGWHIECSAMAKAMLTKGTGCETIDIHCGGVDLKFPHHENEIAQSQCAHGEPMARYWVHNEFLNMGSEKMSKSLGNVKLIRDLLEHWDGEVIRLALLKAHYRSELVWTEDLLKESKAQLDKWYRFVKDSLELLNNTHRVDENIFASNAIRSIFDDLNTIEMISSFEDLYKSRDEDREQFIETVERKGWQDRDIYSGVAQVLDHFRNSINLFGLLQKDPEDWFKGGTSDDEEAEINALIAERDMAKKEALAAKQAGDKALMGQHFTRSDEIRNELKSRGIILEDSPDGTTWRRE